MAFINDFDELLDIRNVSGEVLNIIREELKRPGGSLQVPQDIEKNIQDILTISDEQDKFINFYQQTLAKISMKGDLQNEILLKVKKEDLSKYAIDALHSFTVNSGGKYFDLLLAPAVSRGIQAYTEDFAKGFIDEETDKLNNIINRSFSIIKKNGTDLIASGSDTIKKELEEFIVNIPNSTEKLGKIIIDKTIQKAIDLVQKTPGSIILSDALESIVDFKSEFESFRTQIQEKAKDEFKQIGENISQLVDNEVNVNNTIENIKTEIGLRKSKIESIQNNLKTLASDPVRNIALITQLQIDHEKKVAQSLLQSDLLNKYLNKGIKVVESFHEFEKKAANIFEDVTNFKAQLETLKQPTFSGVVSFTTSAIRGIGTVANALDQLGIAHVAAKKVGEFVNYASAAIGVVTALIPPSPLSIIGILGSIGGLFGSPQPSPEFQLMQQVFEEMQKGFAKINERLDIIEEKTDKIIDFLQKLADFIQVMYKDIMQSLQFISSQLATLEKKLDLITDLDQFLVFSDYNLCKIIVNNKEKQSLIGKVGLNYYFLWYNLAPDITMEGLKALNKFISDYEQLNFVSRNEFFLFNNFPTRNATEFAKLESNIYNDTLSLFKLFNSDIENNAKLKNTLLIPARTVIDQKVEGLNLAPLDASYNFEAATKNYYNCTFIIKITEQYIDLQPFFILTKKSDVNFNPFETLSELIDNQDIVKGKLDGCKERLHNLLGVINYALIQQAIHAGHLLLVNIDNALFGDGSYKDDTFKILLKNELLGKNLATLLISTKIDFVDFPKFSELFYLQPRIQNSIDQLNQLLVPLGRNRLKFGIKDQALGDSNLYLHYINPLTQDIIFSMLVPDANIVYDKQMLYSDSMYGLLASKQKVVNSLIDLTLSDKITDVKEAEICKYIFLKQ